MAATAALTGRARECRALDRMLDAARQGESAVLVLRGEAGIGKTALLRYCASQATDCRVVQIAGVETELEMPFAAVHQLCRQMRPALEAIPEPQQRALQVAFGLASGSAPDRFFVGLAALSLLAESAASQPLLCLVDDAQWLDEVSADVLAFVGRRLLAEGVVLLLAVRDEADQRPFPALPELRVEGLAVADARTLLVASLPGRLDGRVRDRIVAETRGNPLALLELPRDMGRTQLAGGFPVPGTARLSGDLQEHYARRISALPERTRRLMLLAAADPTGDATLLWRAAHTLGVGRDAAALAASEQLLEIGSDVRFRHPLVRSAAYSAASPEDRRSAHLALAGATDAQVDPERRVWHLAAAASGPDDDVAAELEQAADAAQARGGLAAAAAFLERSAALTAPPAARAERTLAAVQAHMYAGAFDAAHGLLAEAGAVAVDELQRARVERMRGQIQWVSAPGREAPLLLLHAAGQLARLDAGLARETYLEAWMASWMAGRFAEPGGRLDEVSRAARSTLTAEEAVTLCGLFLEGHVQLVLEGMAAAEARLRAAVDLFLEDRSAADWLQWGHLATSAAVTLWDARSWEALAPRHIDVARASGALPPLAMALAGRAMFAVWCGDFEEASALIAEETALKDVTGIRMYTPGALLLAAYQGRPEHAAPLIEAIASHAVDRGEGQGLDVTRWTTAILSNGVGRYDEALDAAEQAADHMMYDTNVAGWATAELIEAATRSGRADLAEAALVRLTAGTDVRDSDWAAGIAARCRALVSDGSDAERWYAEAVDRLGRTPLRVELARAHLLYGEWLRRQNMRVDARQHLRDAYQIFAPIGAEGFAERARRELVATGEKVRKGRDVDTHTDLTEQEQHIARLARDGRTNAEIGAELFLSSRTVEWHLGNVFTKLGISSRRGLQGALPRSGATTGA